MNRGVVKWFDSKKGYGFITGENFDDVFVHWSELSIDGFKTLEEGQEVVYEVEQTDKMMMARRVSKIVGQ